MMILKKSSALIRGVAVTLEKQMAARCSLNYYYHRDSVVCIYVVRFIVATVYLFDSFSPTYACPLFSEVGGEKTGRRDLWRDTKEIDSLSAECIVCACKY